MFTIYFDTNRDDNDVSFPISNTDFISECKAKGISEDTDISCCTSCYCMEFDHIIEAAEDISLMNCIAMFTESVDDEAINIAARYVYDEEGENGANELANVLYSIDNGLIYPDYDVSNQNDLGYKIVSDMFDSDVAEFMNQFGILDSVADSYGDSYYVCCDGCFNKDDIDRDELSLDAYSLSFPQPEEAMPEKKVEYVPYYFSKKETRTMLRGKWVFGKDETNIHEGQIISFDYIEGDIFCLVGSAYKTARELLDNYVFENGEPCGAILLSLSED